MFTIVHWKTHYYATIQQNIHQCFSYIRWLEWWDILVSNWVISTYDEIEPMIEEWISLTREIVTFSSKEAQIAFRTSWFYRLSKRIKWQLPKLLKKRDFIEIEFLYENMFSIFLENPSDKTAEDFIGSFVIKDLYFTNLKNRYQAKVSEDTITQKFRIMLTKTYDELRLSELKNYSQVRHIYKITSPLFITYWQTLERQGKNFDWTQLCWLQDFINGTYNQTIEKRRLIQYLFRVYLFDKHKDDIPTLLKYTKQYRKYINENIDLTNFRIVYELEHKTDVMLNKYIVNISINTPMNIIISDFILGTKKYKEVMRRLYKYENKVRKIFHDYPYFIKIFESNFIPITTHLEWNLRILTEMYEKFWPDFEYTKVIDKEFLRRYFWIPYVIYRTDNIEENEKLLTMMNNEQVFTTIKDL